MDQFKATLRVMGASLSGAVCGWGAAKILGAPELTFEGGIAISIVVIIWVLVTIWHAHNRFWR